MKALWSTMSDKEGGNNSGIEGAEQAGGVVPVMGERVRLISTYIFIPFYLLLFLI